jgi:alkylation response protein AidB-like acyl-CoA dehydrogenase
MNFNYTEEQLALQDTLRRFIAKDYAFEHRRAHGELGRRLRPHRMEDLCRFRHPRPALSPRISAA